MRKLLNRIIFFMGWLLSPFTFWNDVFVNIPLSYVMASLTLRFIRADFLALMLAYYWISNGLGVCLMWYSGRKLIAGGRQAARELMTMALTVIAYSLILALLNRVGFLKPL